MKPPRAFSVPPADGAGDEVTLIQIAQEIEHKNEPYVFLLKDDLTTLKLALVTNSDWQIHAQERAFFPVLTVDEFAQLLCWAGRARAAGQPWNLRTIKKYAEFRVMAHKELGGLEFLEMRAEPPEDPEVPVEQRGWGAIKTPKGWTGGKVEACVVCGRGVVTKDTHGHPMHPECERKAPCRSSSTS